MTLYGKIAYTDYYNSCMPTFEQERNDENKQISNDSLHIVILNAVFVSINVKFKSFHWNSSSKRSLEYYSTSFDQNIRIWELN